MKIQINLGWLFLLFLALKLMGYIDWSWWWVTAPLWIPIAVVLGGLAIAGIILIFAAAAAALGKVV
jgi:hypothetical protein